MVQSRATSESRFLTLVKDTSDQGVFYAGFIAACFATARWRQFDLGQGRRRTRQLISDLLRSLITSNWHSEFSHGPERSPS
jgi:hypothetical protein